MNRFAIICSLAATLAVQAGTQQAPVFRGATAIVPVFVTVTDKAGRLVTTLTRDDFTVLDNGRPQAISVFDNSPQPLHLIEMLDVSGSMYGNYPLLRSASEQLFARLRPEDQARVGSFGSTITISPTFSNDASELMAAVPASGNESAPTPLWAALNEALDGLKGIEGRRVVLVLSDGKDTGPLKFSQFLTGPQIGVRAQNDDVMIYAVGLRSRASARARAFNMANMGNSLVADLPDPGLSQLALETGGGYFEIEPRDDLGATFARAVDELHSQYLLGFPPPDRDGKRHKIEVRLRDRDLTPRARKNYLAPSGQ
jgi:Ca-activated chloride channel homolog